MTVPGELSGLALAERNHAIGLVGVSSTPGWLESIGRIVAGRAHAGDTTPGSWRVARVFLSASQWNAQQLYEAYAVTYSGHTAMLARVDGRVAAVVGWNPNVEILRDILSFARMTEMVRMAMRQSVCVQGRWFDDRKMIEDPTAVSFEIPVPKEIAATFARDVSALVGESGWPAGREGAAYRYSFDLVEPDTEENEPGEIEISANCAVAAVRHLRQRMTALAAESGRSPESGGDPVASGDTMRKASEILDAHETSSDSWWKQGRIMQAIPLWQEALDGWLDARIIDRQLRSR